MVVQPRNGEVGSPRSGVRTMSRTSLKCTRDLRDYPPEAYRLPNDGRKWKKLCSDRRALAMELATFANGDGTSITPGVRRLMKNLGWSRSKLFRYIADLEELKLLTSEIRNTGKGRLTSVRALHVEALTQVPDSQVPKSQIGEEPKSQIDAPQVPDSRAQVPDSRAQVPDRGTSRTPTRTDKDRPLPPTPGGGGFVDPKTSNEGNPNHHPGGGSPAGRDVVVYLKRTFHERSEEHTSELQSRPHL